MFPVRLRKRLMDLAYPAWFMWCASSLLDGKQGVIKLARFTSLYRNRSIHKGSGGGSAAATNCVNEAHRSTLSP